MMYLWALVFTFYMVVSANEKQSISVRDEHFHDNYFQEDSISIK